MLGGGRGGIVIAAIAAEHDGTLWSTDRGFARFAGLSWQDPLTAG